MCYGHGGELGLVELAHGFALDQGLVAFGRYPSHAMQDQVPSKGHDIVQRHHARLIVHALTVATQQGVQRLLIVSAAAQDMQRCAELAARLCACAGALLKFDKVANDVGGTAEPADSEQGRAEDHISALIADADLPDGVVCGHVAAPWFVGIVALAVLADIKKGPPWPLLIPLPITALLRSR